MPSDKSALSIKEPRGLHQIDGLHVCKNQENYETRKKAIRHKGVLLFLTPSALSLTFSAYHAVANGRDSPENFGGFANSSIVLRARPTGAVARAQI